jgi:hypothetical protein
MVVSLWTLAVWMSKGVRLSIVLRVEYAMKFCFFKIFVKSKEGAPMLSYEAKHRILMVSESFEGPHGPLDGFEGPLRRGFRGHFGAPKTAEGPLRPLWAPILSVLSLNDTARGSMGPP